MILVRLYRYITGYIVFCGSGGFAERFINLCSKNRISLWDTKVTAGQLTASTNLSGYKRIRSSAKKSGMRIKIKSKHGLPFALKKLFRRKGLIAGTVASAVLLSVLGNMIWTVEISGNERYTDSQILAILAEEGIYPGAFKSTIDLEKARSQIALKTTQISRMSVNINGCHISTEVVELHGSTDIYDTTKPCNIVSGVDGEVVKIEANYGVPAQKQGSAVTKGDLLISGVMEKTDGTPYFIHAKGSAVIRTTFTSTAKAENTVNALKITKIKKQHSLHIFSLSIPLMPLPKDAQIRDDTKLLTYNGKQIPIGIRTKTCAVFEPCEINLTAEQCALLACLSAFEKEKEALENGEYIEKTVSFNEKETGCEISSNSIIHKTTGIEHYFEVE